MRILTALLAMVCVACPTQSTWAHPGHTVEGGATNALLHYVTHPDHIAQWIIAAVCICLALLFIRSIKRLAPAYAKARKHRR